MNSNTPAYRVWSLTAYAMQDGAVLSVHSYMLKVERQGDTITAAFVDGVEATLERAANLLTWAKAEGMLEVIETVDAAEPATIGKRAASALHADLGRLTYTHEAHYEIASAAAGRELLSLTELTEAEVPVVWLTPAWSGATARPSPGTTARRWPRDPPHPCPAAAHPGRAGDRHR